METPEQKLTALRAQIDAFDASIAALLIERTGVIRTVAKLKAAHWPNGCHIRPGREGQMHRAIADRFNGTDMAPLAALSIWRQLIGASTHLESPLAVTHLAAFPEHGWLAREYFGFQVGLSPVASLTDAMARITENRSNILVLPMPSSSDWWAHAAALHAAGIFIFGALPLVNGNLPDGTMPGVALATVTPEPSGDDISYFVREGTLLTVEGFHTTQENAIFLGAHPRPIQLGA